MNLIGKRIVITRPRAQAEDFGNALLKEGAEPVYLPVIEIVPPDNYALLDAALRDLDQYDWLILTSIYGVDAFFSRLNELRIKNLPQGLWVGVVGPRTAQTLLEHGVTPNLVPKEYTSAAILADLGKNIFGKKFLFPQSNLTRSILADEIRKAGGIVDEIIAYRNIKVKLHTSAVDDLRHGIDIITFASPSSVTGFIDVLEQNGIDIFNLPGNPLLAGIGPATASAAREAGLSIQIEAEEHTIAGLISALKKH